MPDLTTDLTAEQREWLDDLLCDVAAAGSVGEYDGLTVRDHVDHALKAIARMVADAEQRGRAEAWGEGYGAGVMFKQDGNPYLRARADEVTP